MSSNGFGQSQDLLKLMRRGNESSVADYKASLKDLESKACSVEGKCISIPVMRHLGNSTAKSFENQEILAEMQDRRFTILETKIDLLSRAPIDSPPTKTQRRRLDAAGKKFSIPFLFTAEGFDTPSILKILLAAMILVVGMIYVRNQRDDATKRAQFEDKFEKRMMEQMIMMEKAIDGAGSDVNE